MKKFFIHTRASLARAVLSRVLSRPRYRPLLSVVDSEVRGTTPRQLIVDSGGTECTTLPKLIVDSGGTECTTLQKLIVDSEVRGTTLQKLIVSEK